MYNYNNRIDRSFHQDLQTIVDPSQFASVTQTQAHPEVSSKFTFIPTSRALAVLADHGWHPRKIVEVRANEENAGYQKHLVVLRNDAFGPSMGVGKRIPEMLVTNAHNKTASFTFMIGVFEIVCTNGLIVCSSVIDTLKVRHVGYADNFVEDTIREIAENIPRTLTAAEEYSQIKLERREQEAFAKGVIEMRWDGEKYDVPTSEVLHVRHRGQEDPSLWNTMNVIQENVVRGGAKVRNTTAGSKRYGKTTKARGINAINENIRVNRAIWVMMEELAKFKNGASA